MFFIILVIALFIATVIIKKIIELSSDPKSDKDLFPNIQNEIKELTEFEIPFTQLGGTINDASGVNRVSVYGIVSVKTEEDVKKVLHFAKSHKLKIAIAGAKHSMGGQAFATGAVILDMKQLKSMSVDTEKKILTVQSGAIWHDVQNFLNPYNLSVEAMQSIDVPSVGGTISVNAHGMDHRIGGIAPTIKSMRFMLADGSIHILSRENNKELFHAVIGGYGLLGVILDAELKLMENVTYVIEQEIIKTKNFLPLYEKIISIDKIHMFYARLSTAPSSFLKEMIVYTYSVAPAKIENNISLKSESFIKFRRLVFNLARKNHIGREIKWLAEKYLQSYLQANRATRNAIMHRSYAYLKNNFKDNTDVLQEYFLPKDKMFQFLEGLGEILNKNSVVTRNVEIRLVYKDNLLLDYAHGDWLAFVLYLNFDVDEKDKIMLVHSRLIDLSQSLGGSFYLPYLLSATREQVDRSYPHLHKFLELKRKYDSEDLFTSEFYKKYG